jgi:hypothetical protein
LELIETASADAFAPGESAVTCEELSGQYLRSIPAKYRFKESGIGADTIALGNTADDRAGAAAAAVLVDRLAKKTGDPARWIFLPRTIGGVVSARWA